MQFPIQHEATLTVARVTELAEAQRSEDVSCSASEPCQASLHYKIGVASLSEVMKPAICRGLMGTRSDEAPRGKRGRHALKGLLRNLRDPAKCGYEPELCEGMHNFGKSLCKGVGDAHSSEEVSNDHGAKGHYLDHANIETRRTD
jgi:hypothetical protein